MAAAADVYVVPRAFQVEQQLLLYEAAGVLLGSKQQPQAAASRQVQGPALTNSEERVLLLHALLSKATAAFTTDMVSAGVVCIIPYGVARAAADEYSAAS